MENQAISTAPRKCFSYINRKGDTYYLHEGVTKRGNPKYFVSKSPAKALAAVPDGFVVEEDINAGVYVRRPQASRIPVAALERVRAEIAARKHLADHRAEEKANAIIVFKPVALDALDALEETDSFSMFSWIEPLVKATGKGMDSFLAELAKKAGYTVADLKKADAKAVAEKKTRAAEFLRRNVRYEPVMRFILLDATQGTFNAERRCYRGEDDWHSLATGSIATLSRKFIRHIGRESFFDLI